jgi:hypothetical protein
LILNLKRSPNQREASPYEALTFSPSIYVLIFEIKLLNCSIIYFLWIKNSEWLENNWKEPVFNLWLRLKSFTSTQFHKK